MPIEYRTVRELFDELQRRLDDLNAHPERDNEAIRHDRLVLPFLTASHGLGWDITDIISQPSILLPQTLTESHVFRNAKLVSRTPDLLISPTEVRSPIAVVEEKKRQTSSAALDNYRYQLHEYQASFRCVWGLLSDGEHWILKRAFETVCVFESLLDLKKGLVEVQELLSKARVMHRLQTFGTADLVIVVPFFPFNIMDAETGPLSIGTWRAKATILTGLFWMTGGSSRDLQAIIVDNGGYVLNLDHSSPYEYAIRTMLTTSAYDVTVTFGAREDRIPAIREKMTALRRLFARGVQLDRIGNRL